MIFFKESLRKRDQAEPGSSRGEAEPQEEEEEEGGGGGGGGGGGPVLTASQFRCLLRPELELYTGVGLMACRSLLNGSLACQLFLQQPQCRGKTFGAHMCSRLRAECRVKPGQPTRWANCPTSLGATRRQHSKFVVCERLPLSVVETVIVIPVVNVVCYCFLIQIVHIHISQMRIHASKACVACGHR